MPQTKHRETDIIVQDTHVYYKMWKVPYLFAWIISTRKIVFNGQLFRSLYTEPTRPEDESNMPSYREGTERHLQVLLDIWGEQKARLRE